MEVRLYNTSDDRIVVNKTLTDELILEGTLKESLNVLSPSVMVTVDVSEYNYMYIPEFDRYYYINSVEVIKNGLWQIRTAEVDVLMSWKDEFLQLNAIVDKTETLILADEYINDGSFVTSSKTYNTIYNFPDGFNDEPDYILLTAGGLFT